MWRRRKRDLFYDIDRSSRWGVFDSIWEIVRIFAFIAAPCIIAVIWAIVLFQWNRTIVFFVHSILSVAWVIKLFINYKTCYLLEYESFGYSVTNTLHNGLTFGGIIYFSIITELITTYNCSVPILILVGIAIVLVAAYLIRYRFPLRLKTIIYTIMGFIMTFVVLEFEFVGANMIGAEKVEENIVTIQRMFIKTKSSGKAGTSQHYYVNVVFEDEMSEEFEVPITKYREYDIGDRLVIPTFKGKFGVYWRTLDPRVVTIKMGT